MELGVADPELVGRTAELEDIGASLEATVSGTACTLVVSGDPGVGKTALVQRACAAASGQMWILAGAALPLASLTVPFLALRAAIRRAPWVEGISNPVNGAGGWAANDVIVSIDDWLTQLCRVRPVALVVDDLQWADQGTLDVLMYLIAGPGDRRLSILATLRSGEIGEAHPLRRWLADIRRMPRISWVRLDPLDGTSTAAQIAQVLRAPAHQSLAQEVYSHTAGNAYLNRLLVTGLPPGTRHLPERLPEDLKAAVLRSWRGLSEGARQLTALMAVGGRPIGAHALAGLDRQAGSQRDVAAILHEAAEAGITECGPDGEPWWFHHPMISEVLEQGLESGQRRDWHALFAAYGARLLAEGATGDFEFLAALAQHHDAAGHTAEAYRWALRAAAGAQDAGAARRGQRCACSIACWPCTASCPWSPKAARNCWTGSARRPRGAEPWRMNWTPSRPCWRCLTRRWCRCRSPSCWCGAPCCALPPGSSSSPPAICCGPFGCPSRPPGAGNMPRPWPSSPTSACGRTIPTHAGMPPAHSRLPKVAEIRGPCPLP